MDIRQLRTFSCVAELGSLSKASDTLRVAQPALSRQIKLLEHELRADLFTRNGRGMVLTDAGRLLLARTAGIVRQIDQVRDEIQSAGGPPSGHFSGTWGAFHVPSPRGPRQRGQSSAGKNAAKLLTKIKGSRRATNVNRIEPNGITSSRQVLSTQY